MRTNSSRIFEHFVRRLKSVANEVLRKHHITLAPLCSLSYLGDFPKRFELNDLYRKANFHSRTRGERAGPVDEANLSSRPCLGKQWEKFAWKIQLFSSALCTRRTENFFPENVFLSNASQPLLHNFLWIFHYDTNLWRSLKQAWIYFPIIIRTSPFSIFYEMRRRWKKMVQIMGHQSWARSEMM